MKTPSKRSVAKRSTKGKVTDETPIKPADFVSALARGIEVLTLFSEERTTLSTSEVADLTGVSRAAARRSLLTLTALRYLRNDNETFSPLPKMLELGYAYLSTWNVRETIQPYLEEVVAQLSENCSFGVFDQGDAVYLARAEARRIVQSINMSVGTRVPAEVSAMGRVLLAGLPESELLEFIQAQYPSRQTARHIPDPILFRERIEQVKDSGYALVDGEFELGLLSVAVPITDISGQVIGAVNVGAPSSRADADRMLTTFLPVLRKAADAISNTISMRSSDIKGDLAVRILHSA